MNSTILIYKTVAFFVLIIGALAAFYYSKFDNLTYLGLALFILAGRLREHILFYAGTWKRAEEENDVPPDVNNAI